MPIVVSNKNAVYDVYDPLEDKTYREGIDSARSWTDAIMTTALGTTDAILHPELKDMLKNQRTARQESISKEIAKQIAEEGNLGSLLGVVRVAQLFILGFFNILASAWDIYHELFGSEARKLPWRRRLKNAFGPILQFLIYTAGTLLLVFGVSAAMFIAAPVLLATASWLGFANKLKEYIEARRIRKSNILNLDGTKPISDVEFAKRRNGLVLAFLGAAITTIVVVSLFTPIAPITITSLAVVAVVAYVSSVFMERRIRKMQKNGTFDVIDDNCKKLVENIFKNQLNMKKTNETLYKDQIKFAMAEKQSDPLIKELFVKAQGIPGTQDVLEVLPDKAICEILNNLQTCEADLQSHGISPRESREKIHWYLMSQLHLLTHDKAPKNISEVSTEIKEVANAIIDRYDSHIQANIFDFCLNKIKIKDFSNKNYSELSTEEKLNLMEKLHALSDMVELMHHTNVVHHDTTKEKFLKEWFGEDDKNKFMSTLGSVKAVWSVVAAGPESGKKTPGEVDDVKHQSMYELLYDEEKRCADKALMETVIKRELVNNYPNYLEYKKIKGQFESSDHLPTAMIQVAVKILSNHIVHYNNRENSPIPKTEWEELNDYLKTYNEDLTDSLNKFCTKKAEKIKSEAKENNSEAKENNSEAKENNSEAKENNSAPKVNKSEKYKADLIIKLKEELKNRNLWPETISEVLKLQHLNTHQPRTHFFQTRFKNGRGFFNSNNQDNRNSRLGNRKKFTH